MANWYSDQFGTDGSEDTTVATPTKVSSSGVHKGRKRIARGTITVLDTAAADVLWMFTLKSSDRLYTLEHYTDGGFNSSSSNELGIYTSSITHDGAVLDVDLYGASLDLTTAIDTYTETFSAGALGGEDRGKTLWEQLAVGDQTYTTDPGIDLDFCLTLNANDDATSSTYVLIATYVSD